jgi:hypothetical protein
MGGPVQGNLFDEPEPPPPGGGHHNHLHQRGSVFTAAPPPVKRPKVVSGVASGVTSFHYFEERNYGNSREFSEEPHHSWDLEHDALQVSGPSLPCLLSRAAFSRFN